MFQGNDLDLDLELVNELRGDWTERPCELQYARKFFRGQECSQRHVLRGRLTEHQEQFFCSVYLRLSARLTDVLPGVGFDVIGFCSTS